MGIMRIGVRSAIASTKPCGHGIKGLATGSPDGGRGVKGQTQLKALQYSVPELISALNLQNFGGNRKYRV